MPHASGVYLLLVRCNKSTLNPLNKGCHMDTDYCEEEEDCFLLNLKGYAKLSHHENAWPVDLLSFIRKCLVLTLQSCANDSQAHT